MISRCNPSLCPPPSKRKGVSRLRNVWVAITNSRSKELILCSAPHCALVNSSNSSNIANPNREGAAPYAPRYGRVRCVASHVILYTFGKV